VEGFRRLLDFSSVDPYELLIAVKQMDQRTNVGGIDTTFSTFSQEKAFSKKSPMTDLHSSATGPLFKTSGKEKLHHSVEQSSSIVCALPSILFRNHSSPSFINAASEKMISRKRSFQEFHTLKKGLACHKCVRLDWTGVSNASAMCYDTDRERLPSREEEDCKMNNVARSSPSIDQPLVAHKFKCRITMEGKNVIKGIKALLAAGYAKNAVTVPHFMKDVDDSVVSQFLGDRDIICVENGDVVLSKSTTTNGS
jgi:hypothetical protein